MTELDILNYQQRRIETEIAQLQTQIRSYELLYESLRQFQTVVASSHTDYQDANTRITMALHPIELFDLSESSVSRKYYNGINGSLTGIGGRVVNMAFVGLGVSIKAKLFEYKTLIRNSETQIIAKQTDLLGLQQDIRRLESEENV